jgi:hypothetical protein
LEHGFREDEWTIKEDSPIAERLQDLLAKEIDHWIEKTLEGIKFLPTNGSIEKTIREEFLYHFKIAVSDRVRYLAKAKANELSKTVIDGLSSEDLDDL